jgi:DNA-directed RNA polymerase specialized sigma24 family protein
VKKMGFNYGLERKKFNEKWLKLKAEYKAAGMTDEQIEAVYDFDFAAFNEERSYRNHNERLFETESRKILAANDDYYSNHRYGWLEGIEDIDKFNKIMALPNEYREAFTMYVFDGYSQTQISSILLKPQRSISRWIGKIAEILK